MAENEMDDDVLEAFEEEHAERKRLAAEEAERRRIEQGTVPRIERQGRKGTLVLVRSQPNDGDGHAVTVRFSDAEWATIRRAILAEHELRPLAEP
jgi:hypothetical protein